jgi:hypothetical protein
MYIYKTTNKINGKVYIGKSVDESIDYLGSENILKHSIKKYGRKNFIKEIIVEVECIQDLNILEKKIY